MTYGYQNEAGEPIMDGAAYRFEQQLDYDYAEEQARMAYDEEYFADYAEEEPDVDFDQEYGDEDSWLDGSYEE